MRFLLSKALMSNASELKVFLDGKEINFTVNTVGEMQVLNFGYTHSSHDVIVSFSSVAPIPEFPVWAVLMLIGSSALVLVVVKRKEAKANVNRHDNGIGTFPN